MIQKKSNNNKKSGMSVLRKLTSMREFTMLLFVLAVCVVMSIASPVFFTTTNLINTLYSVATSGIVVIGMTAALVVGGFDLSVGSVVGLTGVVISSLFLDGMNAWLAGAIGLAVALAIGAANGFFITKLGLSPFITTLAMSGIARGACYVISKGTTLSVRSMPDSFRSIGQGTVGMIPNIVIAFIVLAVIFDILMRKSKVFRKVFYVGSNEKAARFSGIKVDKVKFGVYVFSSALAGIAGVLSLMRFGMASPVFGTGLELSVISGAVIGGCSLNGGEGSVMGAVLGVILLGIVASSMTLLKISVFWQELATSLILLIAVSMDFISESLKEKKRIAAVKA